MLGSDLVRYLRKKFKITLVNKYNYQTQIGKSFDIVINANGNSKRFWANQNPFDDFIDSTVSVYKSIFDFPCDLYIYISSSDVYENHTSVKYTREDVEIDSKNLQPYGFNKYLAEKIIKKYKEKFLILRSSMILGENLKKGPFYDIFHNTPLFVTSKTKLQLITTQVVADIIEALLEKSIICETLNIGGKGIFDFTKIREHIDHKFQISSKAETQIYEMNVEKIKNLYPGLETSNKYFQNFLKNYLNQKSLAR